MARKKDRRELLTELQYARSKRPNFRLDVVLAVPLDVLLLLPTRAIIVRSAIRRLTVLHLSRNVCVTFRFVSQHRTAHRKSARPTRNVFLNDPRNVVVTNTCPGGVAGVEERLGNESSTDVVFRTELGPLIRTCIGHTRAEMFVSRTNTYCAFGQQVELCLYD